MSQVLIDPARPVVPANPVFVKGFSPDELCGLYREILFPRLIEEKMLVLLRQGKLSKWFSGIGQEAISTGVVAAIEKDDWILPMHRNLAVFTGRGLDLVRLLRQLMGKDGGYSKGRERSFHFGTLEHHIVGMISHLGSMLPVACGLGLAAKLRGKRQIAVAFTGDGATSEGDFHEAVNLAAVWKLPVLFVIENNAYGLSTHVSEQYACTDLIDRASGYGIPGVVVDGNDLLAVIREVQCAAFRARAGDGPTLMEFKTFRMRGHEEASGTAYIPKHLFETWSKKDPILRLETQLFENHILTPDQAAEIRLAMKERIDEAVDEALASAEPVSTAERELADVYAPPATEVGKSDLPELGRESGPEARYIDAISQGLRQAMRHSDRVVLLGQDIGEYGGAFKVTAGFIDEFGKERVRNTPIIESGAIGAALGLSLDGFTPMVEMQFGDFISCGFNQIANNLAKKHYRWGARVAVVIRCPVGGGMGAGPFHSQNVEAWFTHVAGLKVVAPATPVDAKGLLLAAFEDGNPVLFLEHKFLYRSVKGPVPEHYYTIPIGKGRVAREGRDATIITYHAGVNWALKAAEELGREGKDVEVIDLRSLLPWDKDLVLASVKKTGRALVLHEAPLTGGYGAEIAATIGQEAFEWLDAPVTRLGALDTPVPFSKLLEETFSPKARLLPALRELLRY
ncbi:MAG: dehydrogenase E1 component subunit alpha/beta [Acidobacteria bacterium]|nr:dehydrogenase E1 component subunit alpha/beta [Acidobacteriota bacterium]MCG3194522.1 1-deoxy-D-xylulose-5-phosphate synthase [Thermoanaerobaculia bacterium]MCK6683716.1 dehydrogenase E1 component subunit alpha/beta [Thermoanaerobaculia bacterium]